MKEPSQYGRTEYILNIKACQQKNGCRQILHPKKGSETIYLDDGEILQRKENLFLI